MKSKNEKQMKVKKVTKKASKIMTNVTSLPE